MKLVSESKVRKVFMQQGIEFDRAHILAMTVVNLFLDDKNDHLDLDIVVSQLIKRELVKTV